VGLFWDTKHTHIFTYLLTFPGPTWGYERTVAVCARLRVWTFGKVWEDLNLEVTAGGLGVGRRL